MKRGVWGPRLLLLINVIIMGFVLAPLVVLVGASMNPDAYLAFPPSGFSLKWFRNFLNMPVFTESLRNSLLVGVAAGFVSSVLGTITSYGINRSKGKIREFLLAVFISPLLVPTIVLGLALLQLFHFLGASTSLWTLLLGHIILTLPFVIRTVSITFFQFDRTLEESALTLGENRINTFIKVVLPLIRPGLIAGAIFAFISSFGNLAVSMFLTSARVSLLPIRMFSYVKFSPDPTLAAISTVLIVVTIAGTVVLERLVGLDKLL